jgi:membrane-associated protease RseP (regulator of RpoE activity)
MRVNVVPGGAAAAAGVLDGDRILAVDSVPVRDWTALKAAVSAHGDTPLVLQVQRGGQWLVIPVTPSEGKISIAAPVMHEQVPAGQALVAGLLMPPRVYAATARALPHYVEPSPQSDLMGPVGILAEVSTNQGPPPVASFLGRAALIGAYAWPFVALFGIAIAFRGRRPRATPV